MRISARCDYACRAILELSMNWPKKDPVTINIISVNQNIPLRYLVQILIQLKRANFVDSVRGKEGGYSLARQPKSIYLGEVIRSIQGPLISFSETISKKKSLFSDIWVDVESAMSKVLDRISFEDICDKARSKRDTLIYHI